MTLQVQHHVSDELLLAYATGELTEGWSLAVATHLALCPSCRNRLSFMEHAGGEMLEMVAPEATDDAFGSTPSVAVVLRVLDNDRDPNCDPIAISALAEGVWQEAWGSIALIDQNQAFQYTPPAAPVTFTFPYVINDGRGGEATHAQLPIQEQRGDVRAVQQIFHVVVGARQLIHLGL